MLRGQETGANDAEGLDNGDKDGEAGASKPDARGGAGERGDVVHGNLLLREQARARKKAVQEESKKKKDANAIKDCVPLIDVVKVCVRPRVCLCTYEPFLYSSLSPSLPSFLPFTCCFTSSTHTQ